MNVGPTPIRLHDADMHASCNREINRLKRIVSPRWVTWDEVSRQLHDGDIWWHDNGEQIFPVTVLWSTAGNYFAPSGQWGWTRSRLLSEMSGRWAPCVEPEPDVEYRKHGS